MHDIDSVVESKNVCGHIAFLTARDNSRCLHGYVAAGQKPKPKPKGLRFFGQLVVRCPGGESAVHLLKAGLQSSMGAMDLLAPPAVHHDGAAVSDVA